MKMKTSAMLLTPFLLTIQSSAQSLDFMQRNECLILREGRAPVHTTCISSGGMQGGDMDIIIETLDRKKYPLSRSLDPKDKEKYIYTLQNKPAQFYKDTDGSSCYQRKDKKLGICIGEEK